MTTTPPPSDPELAAEVVELRRQLRLLTTRVERVDANATRSAQGLDEFETVLNEFGEKLAAAHGATTPGDPAQIPPGDPVPAGGTTEEPDSIDMNILFDWVATHIGEWAQRKLGRTAVSGGFKWCAQWYDHPEAITIFWALRRAWLEAVTQPGAAMFAYFRDCYYPALRILTEPEGPFWACTAEEHKDSPFVPTYPPGLFESHP